MFDSTEYWCKAYRGVICHYIEQRCKTGRGIDLFQNWDEDFDEF